MDQLKVVQWEIVSGRSGIGIYLHRVANLTGPDRYAIRCGNDCLTVTGEWEYEPLPVRDSRGSDGGIPCPGEGMNEPYCERCGYTDCHCVYLEPPAPGLVEWYRMLTAQRDRLAARVTELESLMAALVERCRWQSELLGGKSPEKP